MVSIHFCSHLVFVSEFFLFLWNLFWSSWVIFSHLPSVTFLGFSISDLCCSFTVSVIVRACFAHPVGTFLLHLHHPSLSSSLSQCLLWYLILFCCSFSNEMCFPVFLGRGSCVPDVNGPTRAAPPPSRTKYQESQHPGNPTQFLSLLSPPPSWSAQLSVNSFPNTMSSVWGCLSGRKLLEGTLVSLGAPQHPLFGLFMLSLESDPVSPRGASACGAVS